MSAVALICVNFFVLNALTACRLKIAPRRAAILVFLCQGAGAPCPLQDQRSCAACLLLCCGTEAAIVAKPWREGYSSVRFAFISMRSLFGGRIEWKPTCKLR